MGVPVLGVPRISLETESVSYMDSYGEVKTNIYLPTYLPTDRPTDRPS